MRDIMMAKEIADKTAKGLGIHDKNMKLFYPRFYTDALVHPITNISKPVLGAILDLKADQNFIFLISGENLYKLGRKTLEIVGEYNHGSIGNTALEQDDTYLYVVKTGSVNKIIKVAKETMTAVGETAVISDLHGAKVDERYLYIYENNTKTIKCIDKNTLIVAKTSLDSIFNGVGYGMAIDEEYVYLVDSGENKLLKVEKESLTVVLSGTETYSGIVKAADDKYIYCLNANTISNFKKDLSPVSYRRLQLVNSVTAYGGKVYCNDNDRIVVLDADTLAEESIGERTDGNKRGVDVFDGKFYWGNTSTDKIAEYDMNAVVNMKLVGFEEG